MSSKTNISARIWLASSGFVVSSVSSTLRSTPRSAALRIAASELTPPDVAYSCVTIASSLTFSMRAISLRISGEICSIDAMRSASSACSSGGAKRITLRGEVGRGHVGEHDRDRLRVLVAQERPDLVGRRAAQELERRRLDRGGQPLQDLGGADRAERLLQRLARERRAALGQVAAGERQVDDLLEHVLGRLVVDLRHASHLDRERLDHVVRQVAQHLRRSVGAERDAEDRGLVPAFHACCSFVTHASTA